MAVRLVKKGVRIVQLYYSKGDPWDAYADIFAHKVNARNSDQAFAAVIKDLKARGLWNDTLVVCGSEFGRTPVRDVGRMANQAKRGRDHNPFDFTMWLAGGALKGGAHLPRHRRLRFQGHRKAGSRTRHPRHDSRSTRHRPHQIGLPVHGRDFQLRDVAGNVIHDVIA